MSLTLRIILILGSLIAFFMCIKKVKQSKLRVADSIVWVIGAFILIIISIFSGAIEWLSSKLGFMAPVNFVFLATIVFLLIETFISDKLKDLNHVIALRENKEKKNESI